MARGDYEARFKFSKEEHREILYRRQGGRCPICTERLGKKYRDSRFLSLDHRIPQSHGGGDELGNLDLVHKHCNARKGDSCEGCANCSFELMGWDDE